MHFFLGALRVKSYFRHMQSVPKSRDGPYNLHLKILLFILDINKYLANNEDPDETPHKVAFYQGLPCSQR